MTDELQKLERRLIRTLARTSIAYGVIEPDDKILVAVSGGKDSYAMLYLLGRLLGRLPFEIELLAVHVSQGQPGFDPSPLREWLEGCGVPFEIVEQDTYSVVMRNINEGDTPCSVCARMRRGILYTYAEKHGCNKVALGHHRDDSLATVLMNMFYSGKIQAMPPKYKTDDGRFHVIRPLIEAAEDDLIRLAQIQEFPIVPCFLCSGQEDHKRKRVGELLDLMERESPGLKQVMLGSLKNVRPTHLMDKRLTRKD